MKKLITLMLAFTLVFGCFVFNSGIAVSASGYAMPEILDGSDNIFLSYTFNHSYPTSGHRTKEGYMPLVGYYDTEGNLTDIFFDSFLFLPCVTSAPSGGNIYRDNSKPSNFSDWQLYVEDVFLDDYNVPALNQAVGEIKSALGNDYADFKANVFMTVLYPVITQDEFGDVDGDGKDEDFGNFADRKKAVKWLIDEQIKRMDMGDYEHLNLVGFYWFEEAILSDWEERELITYTNDYVHSLDYKSIWIPYYTARGYNTWSEYGFDVACYQPNYMFNPNPPADRVARACDTAKNLGMCIEIESSGDVFSSVEHYNRYMNYLKTCTEKGANAGIKMYYNDGVDGVIYTAYKSKDPIIRQIYDLTYKYASQTLDASEIVYLEVANPFEGYEVVSRGCDYTATEPYTIGEAGYTEVNGEELTDGNFGKSPYGTEWIGFHVTKTESDGKFHVNLDLGKINYNLSLFSLELNEIIDAGVSLPSSVEYLISEDGKNYKSIGFGEIEKKVLSYYHADLMLNSPESARYVRVIITQGYLNFVFASELTVAEKMGVEAPPISVKPGAPAAVDEEKRICRILKENQPAKDLYEFFEPRAYFRNAERKASEDSDIIGTGSLIYYLYNGDPTLEYMVCIPGDLNGDGIIEPVDCIIIKRILLGSFDATDLHRFAADVNSDDELDTKDYILAKRHYLDSYELFD